MSEVVIEAWQEGNAEHKTMFARLNREWLEEYFVVEPEDETMLSDPQGYVVDKGGDILFARVDGKILGVIALLKLPNDVYELSKMGVTREVRGHGLGRKLAEALIARARERNIPSLYICSNRKLERAMALYKNLGFKETATGSDARYKRADITLELPLISLDPTRYGDWEIKGKCVDF